MSQSKASGEGAREEAGGTATPGGPGGEATREAVAAELARLYDLTWKLRKECPWDRKQTQESLVTYTLEETYELIDTINRRHLLGEQAVCSELGDLLFQVFFLACVAEEEGHYNLAEVAASIREKLVRRHPHVFGEAIVSTPEEVRETWEAVKREVEGREGIFHDVAESFPSTLFAQKLQQRAAAVGFDWERDEDVLVKIHEELAEVEQELQAAEPQVEPVGKEPAPAEQKTAQVGRGTSSSLSSANSSRAQRLGDEIGDLLFAVVNLSRRLRVDPELALRRSALRFKERVDGAALRADQDGFEFENMDLDQQEAYYQKAKKELKQ